MLVVAAREDDVLAVQEVENIVVLQDLADRVALDEEPGNIEYRLKYEQVRFAAAFDKKSKGSKSAAHTH